MIHSLIHSHLYHTYGRSRYIQYSLWLAHSLMGAQQCSGLGAHIGWLGWVWCLFLHYMSCLAAYFPLCHSVWHVETFGRLVSPSYDEKYLINLKSETKSNYMATRPEICFIPLSSNPWNSPQSRSSHPRCTNVAERQIWHRERSWV